MKRFALPLLLLAIATTAPAQTFKDYLRMRHQYGVTKASPENAIQGLNGSKVVEIQGVVKGNFQMDGHSSLLVVRPTGETHEVLTDVVPDWLVETEASARFLVRATGNGGPTPRLAMIGVAPEAEVAKIDAAEEAKRQKLVAATTAKKPVSRRNEPVLTSRGGGLYGTIGRRGSRLEAPQAPQRQWVLPSSEVTPIYAGFIKKVNRRLSNAEAFSMGQAIVGFCMQERVDPRLVMAMIMVESGFDPNSVSRTGAAGLGQLMPDTARWMGVRDPFNSTENLYGAIKLIRTHMDNYHRQTGGDDYRSLVLSIAAYNAGAGAVKRAGGVPAYRETQNYVRKVLSLYYRFAGV